MKILELAQKVKNNNSKKLAKMNEKKIAMIIKNALEEIKKEIEQTNEEKILIPNLGRFKKQMMEKEKDGNKIIKERILFMMKK